uniref:Uncharacterized protein n=1 Tax=Brassica oleracea TaxID=3712 RepID=A0A3P6DI89_BRAOL|nr:unnamed protein product [Brassica oleracea]
MSPINTIIAISVVIAAASLIRNFSSPSDNNTFFYYHHCTQPKYFRGSSFFSNYLPGSSYDSNVNTLLTSLVNSANVFTYNHFTVGTYGKTVHGCTTAAATSPHVPMIALDASRKLLAYYKISVAARPAGVASRRLFRGV